MTVSVRYRALQQFFKWAVREEELNRSPMDAMLAPVLPEQPVDVVTTADARELLKVCKGRAFVDRRDTAIILLFLDTGMRLSELAGLSLDDLDMNDDVAFVLGKGRRPRGCPFGAKTGQALDRLRSVQPSSRLVALANAQRRSRSADTGLIASHRSMRVAEPTRSLGM